MLDGLSHPGTPHVRFGSQHSQTLQVTPDMCPCWALGGGRAVLLNSHDTLFSLKNNPGGAQVAPFPQRWHTDSNVCTRSWGPPALVHLSVQLYPSLPPFSAWWMNLNLGLQCVAQDETQKSIRNKGFNDNERKTLPYHQPNSTTLWLVPI